MGLGPPVCMKCMIIMGHIEVSPYWKCMLCGLEMGHHNYEEIGSLFCLTDEQLRNMDEKWGTKELERRIESRKRMAEAEKRDVEQRNKRREESNKDKDFQI